MVVQQSNCREEGEMFEVGWVSKGTQEVGRTTARARAVARMAPGSRSKLSCFLFKSMLAHDQHLNRAYSPVGLYGL